MKSEGTPLARRILERLGRTAVVATGIIVLLFLLIRLPGSSSALAETGMDSALSLEQRLELVKRYREAHHLDQPIWRQFTLWFADIAHFELGRSMVDGASVGERLGRALPPTLWLQSCALLVIFGAGIALGILSAVRSGSLLDRVIASTLFAGYSIPGFWLGTMLLLYLATRLGLPLFPLERLSSRDGTGSVIGDFLDRLHHSVLPVTVLALPGIAVVTRHVRAAMVEALAKEWVRTMTAAGISRRRIVFVYALREAMAPIVIIFGSTVPALVSGSVIVESLFNIDGMGRLAASATFDRDYPVLQSLFLITTFAVLGGFLASDGLLWLVDPRVRARREAFA